MHHHRTLIAALFCALATLTLAPPAKAQNSKCTLNGGTLAFGAYNPGFIAHVDVLGVMTMDCNGKVQAQLGLSVGNGAGASYSLGRVMTSGTGGSLLYNLYTDPSRTLVLGDGTNGSSRLNLVIQGAVTQAFWGRIPAGQSTVLPGIYVDTLIATISY